MNYLNNPRGRGQQTGYYLPISDINRVRLIIVFLLFLFSISFITTQANPSTIVEKEASEKLDNRTLKNLYKDLESIRHLVKKADELRAYNHKMTAGPAPTISEIESKHIRKNCRLIKELEEKAKDLRKELGQKYPVLTKSSIKTSDLAYLGMEDLDIALSIPNPSNWGQLVVLMGIGLVSVGMVGVCMHCMD